MEDAIQIAAQKAGISNYQIKEYPKQKSTFEELMENFTLTIKTKIVKEELGALYPIWSKFNQLKANQGILARMPYDMTIQ